MTEIYLEELEGKKEKDENIEDEGVEDEKEKNEVEEEDVFGEIKLTPEEEARKSAEVKELHSEFLSSYRKAIIPH